MPITKSAKRALRKSEKRRLRNLQKKSEIKFAIKEYLRALEEKNKEKAIEALSNLYKKIDKAAKTFLHKNKARRLKSKFASKLKKVFGNLI